jgi:hypothetical protein
VNGKSIQGIAVLSLRPWNEAPVDRKGLRQAERQGAQHDSAKLWLVFDFDGSATVSTAVRSTPSASNSSYRVQAWHR